MNIIINKYDKRYPYTIEDAWDDKVYCTKEDLKQLKEQIIKILNKDMENT